MSNITYLGVEYLCRSLSLEEQKIKDHLLRKHAKFYWHPAQEYLSRLGDLPESTRNHCLAVYLRDLDWDEPPQSARIKAMDVGFTKWLLGLMCPTFPVDLVTDTTNEAILWLLNPYFIFTRSK